MFLADANVRLEAKTIIMYVGRGHLWYCRRHRYPGVEKRREKKIWKDLKMKRLREAWMAWIVCSSRSSAYVNYLIEERQLGQLAIYHWQSQLCIFLMVWGKERKLVLLTIDQTPRNYPAISLDALHIFRHLFFWILDVWFLFQFGSLLIMKLRHLNGLLDLDLSGTICCRT